MRTSYSPASHFEHQLVDLELPQLIRSICKECHASRLVSRLDGSLEKWEREHPYLCKVRAKAS